MRTLLLTALVAATSAAAQDRPREEELFGAPRPEAPAGPGSPATPPEAGPATTEGRLLGKLGATDNPLAIGGQLYLRSFLFARRDTPPADWTVSAPSLLDAYLDARPGDRVRAFALARMQYDPTLDPRGTPSLGIPAAANPDVLLDQLWLRFDVERLAFITVGKQHVKWGTGRFWNPTDFLHTVRRDPLAPFDQRTGTSMVRVHVPWERLGWNFSAMLILEPLTTSTQTGALDPTQASVAARTPYGVVGGIGGAVRAELALGPGELGLGAVVQRGHDPRFAVDASVGFWEVDVYGEAALKGGSEIVLWRQRPDATADTPLLARYERYDPQGFTPQVTAGLRWSHKYSDEDHFELGVEYFYNDTGYEDRAIYPWLLLENGFTPFYLGRHYGGAYLLVPSPGPWNDTTFVLSWIVNLSDRSSVLRLDHSVLILTYLRLETFAQVRLGGAGGEFTLGLSIPAQDLGGGVTTPAVRIGTPIVDAGVALRVSL